jgi:receptor expression-enhancing protein 5/6
MSLEQITEKLAPFTGGIEATLKGFDEMSESPLSKVSEALTKAEDASKIPRALIVLAGVSVVSLVLFMTMSSNFFTTILGVAYPSYQSFRAIESKDKEDDTKWLTYWVVFGVLTIVEFFTDFILVWLPFYYWIKTGLLIGCMIPHEHNLSVMIYHQFIKPHFKKLEVAAEAAGRATIGSVAAQVEAAAKEPAKKDA